MQRTLDQSALAAGVEVLERAYALDIIVAAAAGGARQAAGVRVACFDNAGSVASVGVVRARAVVLATGGYGQVFAATSNPPAVTGDGAAMAMRAGLSISDVEFVQFHPTVMWSGPDAGGQQALVSEAVRGEGAILSTAPASGSWQVSIRRKTWRLAMSSPRRSVRGWRRRRAV